MSKIVKSAFRKKKIENEEEYKIPNKKKEQDLENQ